MWPFSDLKYGFRSSQSAIDLLTVTLDRIAKVFNWSGAAPAVALIHLKVFKGFCMLVFFTNSSLMEFQVRYLLLFPHFWVIDNFKLFWMGILHKNIQLMLDFLKALFLAMHYYTLLTFLMILSRVWLHNEVLNFHSWILCCHQPFRDKMKIIRIINESVKFISYLTLNYGDCVPFSCIDSFHIIHNLAN